MQSDTIIGIAGAIVLVAVMVGVFAYEYNNTPEDVGNGAGIDFNQTYPFLDPHDDIDGDGVPNWRDDDIDGDGVPNEEDDNVEVTINISGSAPAHTDPLGTGAADTTTFHVFRGNTHIHIEIRYDSGDAPLNVYRLAGGVSGDDDVGSCTDPDGSGSCTIVQPAEILPGQYVLSVRQTQLNADPLPYTGTITITYG